MKPRACRLLVLVICCSSFTAASDAGETIIPDVVYGHKHGMALTFDVFQPTDDANGAGVLFMVSGGWRSSWSPVERSVARYRALLDKPPRGRLAILGSAARLPTGTPRDIGLR